MRIALKAAAAVLAAAVGAAVVWVVVAVLGVLRGFVLLLAVFAQGAAL